VPPTTLAHTTISSSVTPVSMVRQELIASIINYLARLEIEIKQHNLQNRTDINIYAEDIISPLLDEIFQTHLTNLNQSHRPNFPAIDLHDAEKGIAVQVTGKKETSKVYDTLEKFFRHGLHKQYHSLYILFLTADKPAVKASSVRAIIGQLNYQFLPEQHIIDFTFLKNKIEQLDIAALKRIDDVLEEAMQPDRIKSREKSYRVETHQLNSLRRNSQYLYEHKNKYPEYGPEKIDPDLLPGAKVLGQQADSHDKPATVISILTDIRNNRSPHIFLVGEGGSGKTSSLLWAWGELLKDAEGPVPLYINLLDLKGRFTSLLEYIKYSYYKVSEAAAQFETMIARSRALSGPKIVLLLDAYNQLPDTGAIMDEIAGICHHWESAQLVIASRHYGNFAQLALFTTVELQPLRTEQIKRYAVKTMGKENMSDGILSLLANPLRLTMFCRSSLRREWIEQWKTTADIVARQKVKGSFRALDAWYNKGDLCWDYFESLAAYEAITQKAVDPGLLYMVVHQLLPEVGYLLESSGRFSIEQGELLALLRSYAAADPALILNREEDAIHYMAEVFSILKKELTCSSPDETFYIFSHHEFRDYFSACYIHQKLLAWVDSFADSKWSYDNIPGLLREKLLPVNIAFYIGAIDEEHRNIPVYTENGWSRSHYKEDNVLQRALKSFRHKYKGNKIKYAVKNIIDIICAVKTDLTGDNLSNLYLKGINLSNMTLSHVEGIILRSKDRHFFSCNLEKSKMDLEEFMPRRHKPSRKKAMKTADLYDNYILSLRVVTENGRAFLYSGTKAEIIKWDLDEGLAMEKLSLPYMYDYGLNRQFGSGDFFNPFIAFCPIDAYLRRSGELITSTKDCSTGFYAGSNHNFVYYGHTNMVVDEKGWLGIWDPARSRVKRSYDMYKGGWYCFDRTEELLALTHPDGKQVLIWNDVQRKAAWELAEQQVPRMHIKYNIEDKGLVASFQSEQLVRPCAFHPCKTLLLLTKANGTTIEWDYTNNSIVTTFPFSSNEEHILGYDPSGGFIITSCYKYLSYYQDYTLVNDVFDYQSIRHKDFGRLSFWSTSDGQLKKVLDPCMGQEVATRMLFHESDGRSTLIIGNRVGCVKTFDYNDFSSFKTLSPADYPIYPIATKYLPFSRSFITTYRYGLIKLHESQTHICKSTVKGHLTYPDRIWFSPGLLKMAVGEFMTGRIEIWRLDTFTLEEELDCFTDLLIYNVKFSRRLDKIYVLGYKSYFSPLVLMVYDLEKKIILQAHELQNLMYDDDYLLTVCEQKLVYIAKNDTSRIIIYDLETKGCKSSLLPTKTAMVDFGKAFYQAASKQEKNLFSIIDADGKLVYLEYDPKKNRFSFREPDVVISNSTSYTSYQQVVVNENYFLLLQKDNFEQHPWTHQRFEYDMKTRQLQKIAESEEVIATEMINGGPYYTERGYDYDFMARNQLVLFQNASLEQFIVEKSAAQKKDVTTHQRNSDQINIAGCKLPFIFTRFRPRLQLNALSLEKNGAVFPNLYHILNYPYTLQSLIEKNAQYKRAPMQNFHFWRSYILLRMVMGILGLFHKNKKNKYPFQDADNPYMHTPVADEKLLDGKYYPSEQYEWL
jgi:hypothetical protein